MMNDNEILTAVKRAVDVEYSTAYDDELNNLIADAKVDLTSGNVAEIAEIDESLLQAIILYCCWQFNLLHGDLTRSNALMNAYNSKKTQLGTLTGYTDWGDADVN